MPKLQHVHIHIRRSNKTAASALTRVHCNTNSEVNFMTISLRAKMKSLEKYIVACMYMKEGERERQINRQSMTLESH